MVCRRRGLRFELQASDYICRDVLWFGRKDHRELCFIERNLSPTSTMLDVGANFGYYSLRLARSRGGRGNCLAFEPHPDTYGRLCRTLALNAPLPIEAHALALGRREGTGVMRTMEGNSGAASVLLTAGPGADTPTIEVSDLDGFAKARSLGEIEFIKLDVEGGEEDFIDGAQETLRCHKPVILMEVHGNGGGLPSGENFSAVERLKELGYDRFFVIDPKGINTFGSHSFVGGWSYRNVFCLHGNQRDWQ